MICIDAQRLIMPFINKKLDINQMEDFIDHIHSCPNCMEELEVYYVLFSGMKLLDEDKELSINFHQDLLHLIKRSEDRIFHDKIIHIRKRIILIIVITLTAIISSFRITEIVVEDVLHKELFKSNFYIEGLFPDEMDGVLAKKISRHLNEIHNYLIEVDPESAIRLEETYPDYVWERKLTQLENNN
jgi:hypothetical protein